MAIQYYFSTDAGAPVLSGTAGSMISLLDACLVNGYGSKAAAGWTKAYSGTNLAAYRMSTVAPATGFYLRVDDTGINSARLVGYEAMSDVNTGTGPFPTNVQISGGLYVFKSTTSDSTARPWIMIACERSFYLFTQADATTLQTTHTSFTCNIFFGDIITRKATDGYQCMIIASTAYSSSTQNLAKTGYTLSGHYISRNYTGLSGTSTNLGKSRALHSGYNTSSIGPAESSVAFPDPVTQTLILGKVIVMESAIVMRGFLPGFYDPVGGTSVGNAFDIMQGAGSTAGTSFLIMPTLDGSTNCRGLFQITGNWY